jgi:uncharacterized protein (TIGR01244 family)
MNAPAIRQLSADLCVAGQLDPAAMAWAAQAGFRSVINNRPDFEGGSDQPTNDSIHAAARAAGLEYAFLPVLGGYQSPQEIARFAELMAALPKPILAFCRSGARSGRLFQAATTG